MVQLRTKQPIRKCPLPTDRRGQWGGAVKAAELPSQLPEGQQQQDKQQVGGGCGRGPHFLLVGCNSAATRESIWRFLRNRTQSSPPPGYVPPNPQTCIHRDTCTPMSTAAAFTVVDTWKPASALEDRAHGHNGTLCPKQGEQPFATMWMDLGTS